MFTLCITLCVVIILLSKRHYLASYVPLRHGQNTTARTWELGQTNKVSDMCAENYVTIDLKEKVLDLTDSLRTNPTDSVRIGLDLDSVTKIIKNFVNLMLLNKKLEFNDITYCYSFIVQRTILRRILAS